MPGAGGLLTLAGALTYAGLGALLPRAGVIDGLRGSFARRRLAQDDGAGAGLLADARARRGPGSSRCRARLPLPLVEGWGEGGTGHSRRAGMRARRARPTFDPHAASRPLALTLSPWEREPRWSRLQSDVGPEHRAGIRARRARPTSVFACRPQVAENGSVSRSWGGAASNGIVGRVTPRFRGRLIFRKKHLPS